MDEEFNNEETWNSKENNEESFFSLLFPINLTFHLFSLFLSNDNNNKRVNREEGLSSKLMLCS